MTWRRTKGSRQPEAERFWAKVTVGPGCWVWTGALVSKGYGSFRRSDQSTASAHRWTFEQFVGPIPLGLEVDHLCFNRACVRPSHLELVTHAENVRRGRTNQNDGKTQCHRGHPFDLVNTAIDGRGNRVCRICGRDRMRRFRAERSA